MWGCFVCDKSETLAVTGHMAYNPHKPAYTVIQAIFMKKNLHTFNQILIYTTFFVPLLVIPSSFIFPFIVLKVFVFRTLIVLLGASFLVLLATGNVQRKKMDLISWAVLLFFVSLTISTIVGTGFYRSFWDNHERMLGLFTLLHFAVYYGILSRTLPTWETWRPFIRMFLFAGSIVMGIGLLQKVNPELLVNRGSDRVASTLGNAIYVGGYGLFLCIMGALLAVKEKTTSWRNAAMISSGLGFIGIIISGTRGTFIGFSVGGAALLITYLVTRWNIKKIRYGAIAILLFGLIFTAGLFTFKNTAVVKAVPTFHRLTMINFDTLGTNTRIMAWKVGVEAWKDFPIFGWGPNNYFYAFNAYYNPDFLLHGWTETWFDNAHNVVVNTLTTQGLFGLITYLFLFFAPIYALIAAYKRKDVDEHILAFGIMFTVGHFVHNLFVFENVTSMLYFMFFLAFITVLTRKKHAEKVLLVKPISQGALIATAIVALLFINITNIQPAKANMAVLDVMRNMGNPQVDIVAQYTDAQRYKTPHIDDIRHDFSRAAKSRMVQLAQQGQIEEAVTLGDVILGEMEKNMQILPRDPRFVILQAETAVVLAELTKDPARLRYAEQKAKKALEISPKRQQIEYLLASIYLPLGKGEEALQLMQTSIDRVPELSEGYWRLAILYVQIGQNEKALQVIEDAKTKGIVFKPDGLQAIEKVKNIIATQPTVVIEQ